MLVADDRKKQEHFMEGIEFYLQYALLNLCFDDFNHLVDSALNTERKHLEMEDKKRKIVPVASAATLVLASSRPSSTGLPSRTSRGRSSTRLDSSRRVRARGYRHLRLVLHQLRQHRRLHVRQPLPDSRLRHLHASAITAASRGTTPTLAPGRRRRDSRGAQLSPGRQHRLE